MYRIKEIATGKGITIAELAEKIGIHPQSMSRIISKGTKPETLEKIAEALEVTVEELITAPVDIQGVWKANLTPIPVEKLSVMKKITIIAPTKYGQMDVGEIIYRRLFYPQYVFGTNAKSDNFFDEYPQQSSYPHDELDIMILDTIRSNYPDSRLHNRLVCFQTDIEEINRITDRPSKKLNMHINPQLTYDEMKKMAEMSFIQYRLEFNLYYGIDFEHIMLFHSGGYALNKQLKIDEQLKSLIIL